MQWNHFIIVILATAMSQCASKNILILSPVRIKSFYYFLDPLVTHLANQGFDVTTVSPFHFSTHENVSQIFVEDNFNYDQFTFKNTASSLEVILYGYYVGSAGSERLFTNQKFLNLLLSNYTCDMVISMDLPYSLSLGAINLRYKDSVAVSLVNHDSTAQTSWLLGEYFNPAHQPEVKTGYDDNMSFLERLHNAYVTAVTLLVTYFVMLPQHEYILEAAAVSLPFLKERPPLTDILCRKLLVLISSHHAFEYNYVHSPRIKHVAGMSIRPTKPLPKIYENFINKYEKGVIIISWGLFVRGETKAALEKVILSALHNVPYGVIWKYNTTSTAVPLENVLISEWIPQQDLLAHKNVKLFLTHGGMSSTVEATYYGIPALVTPFYSDQFKNARALEKSGAALRLLVENFTAESLLWSMNELLENKKYKENALRRSQLFRDRQLQPPIEEAVYWIKYLLKHGDVLNVASATMPLYKLLMLDVIVFVLVLGASFIFLMKLLITRMMRCTRYIKHEWSSSNRNKDD